MEFLTVEDAYNALGRYVRAFVGNRSWEEAGCKCRIYSKMASGSHWLKHVGVISEKGGFEENPDAMWDGLDAALFLRDDLMRTTGHRIWGLTFTLYPDGKFNIEYDYNKPEGFEETDETVEVDLAGLQDTTRDK
jgi:hypothetical protein